MQRNRSQAEKHLQDNPLEFHLRTFATSLLEDGYRDSGIRSKSQLLADFGKWLGRTARAVSQVDERLVDAFLKHRRQVREGDPKTLHQFLDHLRRRSIVPDRNLEPDQSPLTAILRRYETHLHSERGLAVGTIYHYQYLVRKFLITRFRKGPFLLKALRASDISNFVLRHSGRMSVSRAHMMTAAFRSFFRYLLQKGELQADLAASVPAVANWRQSTVPKYLTPEEVERVLKACDRRMATGRRDYAILLLLARLGLRAGEVVALRLEDINWRASEILVRGKGLLHDWMPLPADVGKAMATYLRRDRPACHTRRVFVCMNAPHRGFASSRTLTSVVRHALSRAELHPASKGAHLLRHSLATSMLRSGATMGEIGEVLRHQDPSATEIYAKVDFNGLRSLAQPWPMGGAQ